MTNTQAFPTPTGLTPATTGMATSYRRSPVIALVDTSGSMAGVKIDGVNDGLDLLVSELRSNPIARETVVLDVIAFGNGVVTSTGFLPVAEAILTHYVPNGDTPMGAGFNRAADDLLKSTAARTAEQKGDYAAHVWALTDGIPTDDWLAAADRLRNMSSVGMINAIAIGPDADLGILAQVVGGKGSVLKLDDVTPEALQTLFVWMSQVTTMATNSRQTGQTATPVAFPAGLLPTI